MPILAGPADYLVRYNGFDFTAYSKTKASFRFVYDQAGRTVKQTDLTLTVESNITDGATQDTSLDNIRAALERPGGQLTVTGLGLGTLAINTAGGRKDIDFGPKPSMLTWTSTGGDYAAHIVWQCTTAVLGCLSSETSEEVMAATFDLNINIDSHGLTTRTIAGQIQIPMTRVSVASGAIPDTADDYIDAYIPRPLPGFIRTLSKSLGKAKNEISFSVTDTEQGGNPLPAGCVAADASHTFSSVGSLVSVIWTGSLSASYTLQKGVPRSKAFQIFMDLAEDRIRGQKALQGGTFIPTSMVMGEPQIYGPVSALFNLNYKMILPGKQGANIVFPTAGLWRPVPGGDWNIWSASLANGAQHPRGLAGMTHDADAEAIVDLCLNNSNQLKPRTTSKLVAIKGGPSPETWAKMKQRFQLPDVPDPGSSWLHWRCWPVVVPVDRNMPHVPLPVKNLTTSTLHTPNFPKGSFDHKGKPFTLDDQDSPPPIIQGRASSGYYVHLVGEAIRAYHEIPQPQLLSVGGTGVVPMNHPDYGTYFSQWLGAWTVYPIFGAQWDLRWFVARKPGQDDELIPIYPNPFQQAPIGRN
jgi:hypothetical protein